MKQAYEVVGEFKEGLARVKKFGFIDKNGEQVGAILAMRTTFVAALQRLR